MIELGVPLSTPHRERGESLAGPRGSRGHPRVTPAPAPPHPRLASCARVCTGLCSVSATLSRRWLGDLCGPDGRLRGLIQLLRQTSPPLPPPRQAGPRRWAERAHPTSGARGPGHMSGRPHWAHACCCCCSGAQFPRLGKRGGVVPGPLGRGCRNPAASPSACPDKW